MNERDEVPAFTVLMFYVERQAREHRKMSRIIWILISAKNGNRCGVTRVNECLVL